MFRSCEELIGFYSYQHTYPNSFNNGVSFYSLLLSLQIHTHTRYTRYTMRGSTSNPENRRHEAHTKQLRVCGVRRPEEAELRREEESCALPVRCDRDARKGTDDVLLRASHSDVGRVIPTGLSCGLALLAAPRLASPTSRRIASHRIASTTLLFSGTSVASTPIRHWSLEFLSRFL